MEGKKEWTRGPAARRTTCEIRALLRAVGRVLPLEVRRQVRIGTEDCDYGIDRSLQKRAPHRNRISAARDRRVHRRAERDHSRANEHRQNHRRSEFPEFPHTSPPEWVRENCAAPRDGCRDLASRHRSATGRWIVLQTYGQEKRVEGPTRVGLWSHPLTAHRANLFDQRRSNWCAEAIVAPFSPAGLSKVATHSSPNVLAVPAGSPE